MVKVSKVRQYQKNNNILGLNRDFVKLKITKKSIEFMEHLIKKEKRRKRIKKRRGKKLCPEKGQQSRI